MFFSFLFSEESTQSSVFLSRGSNFSSIVQTVVIYLFEIQEISVTYVVFPCD